MPAEGRPEMMARLTMRGVRWSSRLTQTTGALRQDGPIGGAELGGEVWRDVDVDQAGDAVAAKESRGDPASPR